MKGKKQESITEEEKNSLFYNQGKFPIISENLVKLNEIKKTSIKLDKLIEQNKSTIYDLFIQKFGPNFFKKYNVIDDLKYIFGQNLFDISELIPDTQDEKIIIKKKIIIPKKKKKIYNEKDLSARIDMGNMTFLNLRENTVSKKSLFNDKLFYLSKNFQFSKKNKKEVANNVISKNKNLMKFNSNINIKNIKLKTPLKTANDNNTNKNEKEKIKKIKLFRISSSQQNINNKIPNNIILKKKLMNNNNNFRPFSSNNQQHFDMEEIIKNINIINPLLIYNSNKINDENKYSNINTNFTNTQNDYYSPNITNSTNNKADKMSFEEDKKNFNPIYINDNMSEVDITNNKINNNYKCLSTYETNNDIKNQKKIFKKYNSLININSYFKSKKFKANFNKDANLLNNFMNKCNKRLVKLIDNNITKRNEINEIKKLKMKDNDNLIKSILDKKTSKKILRNFHKQKKITKSILSMSQRDENRLQQNKISEEKYFIENIKNMDNNVALFYIGQLYDTKYIKFPLKEFKEKKKEIKKQKEKEKFMKIKERLNYNNMLITKYKFKLINEFNHQINK